MAAPENKLSPSRTQGQARSIQHEKPAFGSWPLAFSDNRSTNSDLPITRDHGRHAISTGGGL
jgi:hypothetical protein